MEAGRAGRRLPFLVRGDVDGFFGLALDNPGGLVAVAIGTLLAWLTGIAPGQTPPVAAGLHLPVPVVGDLLTGLGGRHLLAYFSVIFPMGLFNVVGSLQNIESAEAAGDAYPTAPSSGPTAP